MKRIALYARVSTKQHSQNPETQLIPLREYASQRGLEIVNEFVDLGWSGAKERRPQLDRMMAAARRRQFDAVIVWRFDRFARSTKHLVTALEEFRSLNVDFVSMTEAIDTSTPIGEVLFTIMSAFAQLERALIRERVQAGIERAKQEGKKLGRPTVLVDRVKVAERIAAGESIAKVARESGIARGTVRAIVAAETGKKAEMEPVKSLQSITP